MKHLTRGHTGGMVAIEVDDILAEANTIIVNATSHFFDSLAFTGFSQTLAAELTKAYLSVLAEKVLPRLAQADQDRPRP